MKQWGQITQGQDTNSLMKTVKEQVEKRMKPENNSTKINKEQRNECIDRKK